VKEDNDLLTVDMTNPDILGEDGSVIRRGQIYIGRSIFLWSGRCYEQFTLTNFGHIAVRFPISLRYEADYVDIFEVRGVQRARRGLLLPPEISATHAVLSYLGLDNVKRRTRIHFESAPTHLDAKQATYNLTLGPMETVSLALQISFEEQNQLLIGPSHDDAMREWRRDHQEFWDGACRISTSNESFNEWIERSNSDLSMMLTRTPYGRYPYAGIPWYSTPFGRDGIICALQTLWIYPAIAEGVLRFLAATQATERHRDQDAEPGKVIHEMRAGEMASLKEIPFGRYYGSADATPLFIMLAGRYYERTGNKRLIEELWPHIESALHWIETDADPDGDGFIEYQRQGLKGLLHQGWKDSDDAIFHPDGSDAHPPIALCEVQAYAYEARVRASQLAQAMGNRGLAKSLRERARALRRKFHEQFWVEEIGMYALALDGDKRPCRVRTSNAGQCLYCGIATDRHAAQIAQALMSDDFFSGWGVRTVADTEARFNPMSYHNGSVWPHDNAIIAAGLSRYGHKSEAMRIFKAMYEMSRFIDLCRLPELFCGFRRRPGEGPIFYPVACTPQAWASAAVFMLLEACLGMSVVGLENRVVFQRPMLPEFLDEVVIENLRVSGARVDIQLRRAAHDVGVNVIRRDGEVEVVAIK
jgi:glycogen debranching enzyme